MVDEDNKTTNSKQRKAINSINDTPNLEFQAGLTEVYIVISFWSLEKMILSLTLNKEFIESNSILTDHPLVCQLFKRLLIENIKELLCFGITQKWKASDKISLTKKLQKQLEEQNIPLKLLMMSKKKDIIDGTQFFT